MAIVALQNITKVYDPDKPNAYKALDNVSLTVDKGEFAAIMGVSGSGKSTLMNIIGCLDRASEGKYFFDGEDISQKSKKELVRIRRSKIGFIFQNFNLLPRLTILANVELPLIYRGIRPKKRHQRATASLKAVMLGDKLKRKQNMLSGGEQQRVAIARALVNDPALILADEPTGNLDTKSGTVVMDVLKKLNDKGTTIIVVTHDQAIADYAKRTIMIQDGKIKT